MATLSSSKFLGLIDRFLHGSPIESRGRDVHSNFAVRAMGRAPAFTGDQIDNIWLQRVELRSVRQVGDALDGMGFRSRWGCVTTMFVDEGCGLICAENLGSANFVDGDAAVHRVLKLASGYQADGVILATNDPNGNVARSDSHHNFTMKLYRKGQAIGVPLLDHLVLTANGWASMFVHRPRDRP